MASVRVRMFRGAWTVFVQSHKVENASGKLFQRVGPTDEDKARAEELAIVMRRHYGADTWTELDPLPVSRVLEDYLITFGRTLKKSTEHTAMACIRKHLIPYFVERDIRTITREDLLQFATSKAESGKSVALVKNSLSLFRRVCNLAIESGKMKTNPAARIGTHIARLENRHSAEVRQIDSWTREEVANLLALAREKEPRLHPMLLTALHTGCRRGELLGLQWIDVDFARGRIRIRRSRVKGRTGTPKSGKGREVVMSAPLRETLEQLRVVSRKGTAFRGETWVFPARGGKTPIEETTFSRSWRRLVAYFPDRGIRPLVFHCARHTFATLALEAGKSIKWVAEQLGHADATITLRVYAHAVRTEESDLGFLDFEAPPKNTLRLHRAN